MTIPHHLIGLEVGDYVSSYEFPGHIELTPRVRMPDRPSGYYGIGIVATPGTHDDGSDEVNEIVLFQISTGDGDLVALPDVNVTWTDDPDRDAKIWIDAVKLRLPLIDMAVALVRRGIEPSKDHEFNAAIEAAFRGPIDIVRAE